MNVIHHDRDDLAAFDKASRSVVKSFIDCCILFEPRVNEVLLLCPPTIKECLLSSKDCRAFSKTLENASRWGQTTDISADLLSRGSYKVKE